jgi:shikimate dehydrogenase
MLDFTTFGLFGERITGSLAPQIYNAFFEELDMPAVYMPFPVEKDKFISALPVLRSDFSGFNVGEPFRVEITVHIDRMDDTAKHIGAVSTVKVEDGKLYGYNTDAVGFERSLIGFMGNIYDKDVLLLGSGGAAHAVANIFLKKGAFLTILTRNMSHAALLRDVLQNRFNKNRIKILKGLTGSDEFFACVNTTGIDIEGKQSEISIHTNTYKSFQYAYDLCCGSTAFLKKAADFGADTKDGLDMLFYQSVGSLDIWLGKDKGLDVTVISKVYDQIKAKYKNLKYSEQK